MWNLEEDPDELEPIPFNKKKHREQFLAVAGPLREKAAADMATWWDPGTAVADGMTPEQRAAMEAAGYLNEVGEGESTDSH